MTGLRRYAPMKASRGTVIPPNMKLQVFTRDGGCIGIARLPGSCAGSLEPDHVRASHGIGMKSVTCPCNLVSVCGAHHRYKTEHGREVRPIFLAYLALFEYTPHVEGHLDSEHTHVELIHGCSECEAIRRRAREAQALTW